jgi:integrase
MAMARRRANNEGSLYYRKARGCWCAQVSLEGRRLTKYGKTQKECRDWIRETLTKIEVGLTYEGTQVTLERFIEIWLNGKELSRSPRTVFQYRETAGRHIVPMMGKMRLQDIHPAHIKQLYARKKEEGRGPRTLQLIHAVLHCALKQAVREGILGRNPADAVERPKVEQSEFKILTEEQARQFLIAAADSPFEALYFLALTSGMRQGELLGLKWSDLDWEKGILLVQRQLQRVEHKDLVLSPPKTRAGRRQIKLGQGILEKLASHQSQQELLKAAMGDRWQENELMFPSSIGTPLDSFRVSHEFKKLLKRYDLPDIRFHDLRHTNISFLLEVGTPLNTVQRRAGHAKASITADVYGHAMARSQDEAAQKIEDMVLPIAVKLQSEET